MKKIIILILLLLLTPTLVNAETKYLYDILKNEAESNGLAKEYTGEHHDSFTEEPSKKIYHWYTENDEKVNQILEKNNIIFGNFCWQIIRTTDTGGTKVIYNGMAINNQCNNTGEDTLIGYSEFNVNYGSPAYAGYMYNSDTLVGYKDNTITSGSLFGNGVTYTNGIYTLTDTSTTYDDNHHYSCNNTTGSCSIVRYYYYGDDYLELNDGRDITKALQDMLSDDNVNKKDSTVKTMIDTWFQNNLLDNFNLLEDTIFCNNRTITSLGSFNPNGGGTYEGLKFRDNVLNNNLKCVNVTDQFSVSNDKAKLKYPVGLLSVPEMDLFDNEMFRSSGEWYWLSSPSSFVAINSYIYNLFPDGSWYSNGSSSVRGVRPAISLKHNSKIISGDGSKNNPYIIDTTKYYKVTVEKEIKNGDIEFETENINNLPEGEEVKFKIVPNKGYILKDISITDENNNKIDYTTTDNINFRFTMPATDVTINPQYKEIESNIINPNTKRQILLIVISVIILSIMTFIFIKKKKHKN